MKVYFDTNVIIYFLERNPAWFAQVAARVATLRAVGDELCIGDLSRAECLIGPLKSGNAGLEARYRALFNDPNVIMLPITVPDAARLRARFRSIKLPDALHLATAVVQGCGSFVTADAKLASCTSIVVEVLK